jgi:ubiquinone/menaquinone biosynthesis C-methylase UbiE
MNFFQKIRKKILTRFNFHKTQQQRIVSFWEGGGIDFDYYTEADREQWLNVFWNEETLFYQWFQQLNVHTLLEIACGTGRHSAQVCHKTASLYLLDSSAAALALARKRFAAHPNVQFIQSASGIPENIVAAGSVTAVFSYDAMVHFEKETVYQYLRDSFTVLQTGGYALFHHSNYSKNKGGQFTDNPGWRNYMTQELFLEYAHQCGFEVVQSQVFSFSCPDSDGLTLLWKP